MERELTQRCRRQVRVAEFVDTNKKRIGIRSGSGDPSIPSSETTSLFAGYVETLYARNAWLAVRVDIWASRSICYRQVRSSSVYLKESADVQVQVASGEPMADLQKVTRLGVSVTTQGDELPALSGNELTQVLEELVQLLVEAFQKVQVQALEQATSHRAKFEYEMLQHHSRLEVLLLKSKNGARYVLFALPLLGEKVQWDPKVLIETEDPESVYIPDGFHAPNFSSFTDELTVFIGYPMKEEDESKSDSVWPLFVEWPVRMLLSSQVTQTPPSSKAQSSIEVISFSEQVCNVEICSNADWMYLLLMQDWRVQMFLQQWRRRKDFIAELRRHVIVFEYDAVDFSQTVFMLQEQLDEQSPLRIIVLRMQFTAAFFLTNCMSDLQVTMMDGETSVTVGLPASSSSPGPEPTPDSKSSVGLFLESTRKSLLQHFYGEMG